MCFSGVFYFEEIQIERLNVPGMACSALISHILAGMATKLLINITGLILLKFGTPCETCEGRCQKACPVNAFPGRRYSRPVCLR